MPDHYGQQNKSSMSSGSMGSAMTMQPRGWGTQQPRNWSSPMPMNMSHGYMPQQHGYLSNPYWNQNQGRQYGRHPSEWWMQYMYGPQRY